MLNSSTISALDLISQHEKNVDDNLIKSIFDEFQKNRQEIKNCEERILFNLNKKSEIYELLKQQHISDLEEIIFQSKLQKNYNLFKNFFSTFKLNFKKFINYFGKFFYKLFTFFKIIPKEKKLSKFDFPKKGKVYSFNDLGDAENRISQIQNNIFKNEIDSNFFAFKFVLNYLNYHRMGGQITADFLTEVGHNFAKAIEFLEFFNNPENLSSNYLISHDELSKFISSYRLFYDISPELNYGIVSEEFAKVNSLYLKSIELVKENNELHKNFGDFNKLVEEYRINENSISLISQENILLFLEIKKQIHDRLDIGLPIGVNELQTLKNYIFLHNKLSDLKKIDYDISINKVAERIRSLQPSNQSENSNNSLISRKNIPAVIPPSFANNFESFSCSNPQLNAHDSPKDVPGVNVRQMVEKYNTISSPEIDKKIDKLRESKALAGNGVARVFGKKNDGSVNLGVGKVFVAKLEKKSDEGKEVSV